jgi:hypothetical protein
LSIWSLLVLVVVVVLSLVVVALAGSEQALVFL